MCAALIVPLAAAQTIRQILEQENIWDENRRLQKINGNKIAIPLLTKAFDEHILSSALSPSEYEIVEMKIPRSKKAAVKMTTPSKNLQIGVRELLEKNGESWSKEIENDIPCSWEKHGNLILLPSSSFQLPVWKNFGEDLWKVVAKCLGCSRLALKSYVCDDGFRTPQVNIKLGQDGWVDQIDNKIRFTYDVTKCMFSIGNITEKLRIANFDCSSETIVDLYAGIGYFTLPYLVHARAGYVHACEWNIDAVKALKKNLELNGVEDRCTVHYGDNKEVCPVNIADRVNLGLIPTSELGWPVACAALKQKTGGFLHIHSNVTTNSPNQCAAERLTMCENKLNCVNRAIPEQIESVSCVDLSCDGETVDRNGTLPVSNNNFSSWAEWGKFVSREIQKLLIEVHHCTWTTKVIHIEHVKSYAPHVDHLVLDLECRPL